MSRFRTVVPSLALALLLCSAFPAAAQTFADEDLPANFGPTTEVKLDPPLNAIVYLKHETPGEVSGRLLRYSRHTLVITAGGAEKPLHWADLTPSSAYTLRGRLINKDKADDWLALGAFGYSIGAKEQANTALSKAVSLDPSLKDKVQAVREGTSELLKPTKDAAGAATRPAKIVKGRILSYQPATKQEHAEALAAYRKTAAILADHLSLKMTDFETDHFLVFTDWDPREHAFLKKNLELAYTTVSKQFAMNPRDNVFVGKLPIYMFSKREQFTTFAVRFDGFPAGRGVGGYFHATLPERGIGHMAMPKPDFEKYADTREAERMWAYILTHEFTHAFVARYRTNTDVPRWLNEGVAEVIASRTFPDKDRGDWAILMTQVKSIQYVFDDNGPKTGMEYPVMQTLVETLLAEKPARTFLAFFNDIKDGMNDQEALKKHYKMDFHTLEAAWRAYIKRTVQPPRR